MQGIIKLIVENHAILLGVALAISESMALVPSWKSSGLLDFVIKGLKKALGKE